MKFKDIYSIIPENFRKKGILVAASLFLRALLDFAGVVVFIPVLAGVLEDGGDAVSVLPVAAAAMAFIIVKNLAVVLLTRFRSRYVFSLYATLSDKVLRSFMARGLLFVRKSDSVDLANKVNAVTMTFTSGVMMSLLNAVSSVLLLLIILVSLFIYEPLPTLAFLLVIGPFMFFYTYFIRSRMKRLGVEENEARRGQARSVFQLLKGYPEYFINGAVGFQMDTFHSNLSRIRDVRMKSESYSALSTGFMEMTVMLSIVILMLLSMSTSWGMSMTFGIFALSAMKILPSVRAVVGSSSAIQSAAYSVDVLKDMLDGPVPDLDYGRKHDRIRFDRSFSLRSVSFGYGGELLFKDFSLEIRKGDYIGIKGHSGAGKTTLFNLLMGFYEPEKGGLYVDDVKITRENVGSWQSAIGYVPQDVFLVSGTFVENVAFGSDPAAADRQKLAHIFRKVGLWDWISSLPEGMDTRLAEAGNSVSGGQRQRIGIARALYKGASVLFFDEATSSVDVKAEAEINSFIAELSRVDSSLTVVVIAHRQETLASCRTVIDLDELTGKKK